MEGGFACYADYLWFHEELSSVRMRSNIKGKPGIDKQKGGVSNTNTKKYSDLRPSDNKDPMLSQKLRPHNINKHILKQRELTSEDQT